MAKILLVEDEDNIRDNISTLLTMTGFSVKATASVEEALAELRSFTPDLILCDVIMQGAHGYILLQTLQKMPDLNNVPFIFLTAKAELSDIRKGMNLGADDYITKPFKHEELVEAINTRLKRVKEVRPVFNPEAETLSKTLQVISKSEIRILKMLAENKSSLEISKQLFISLKTVQNHRSNMVRKLSLSGYNALHHFATQCHAYNLL
jgi:DNA-binding NarL/FixJ family response regulator